MPLKRSLYRPSDGPKIGRKAGTGREPISRVEVGSIDEHSHLRGNASKNLD